MKRKKAENNPFIRDGFWKPPKDMIVYGPQKKTDRQMAFEYLKTKGVFTNPSCSYSELARALWNTTGTECKEHFNKREAKKYIKKFLRAASGKTPRRKNSLPAQPSPNRIKQIARHQKFLDTWEWTTLRYQVLQKFGRRCMCCGATPETGATLHVDHIKPRSKFPHLALDINNLQVLCAACNKGKGNWDETDFREIETTLTPEQEEHMRSILQ